MSNVKVETTKIEKKYTDKKGNERTITIDYAKVAKRLEKFREANPRGLIRTEVARQDKRVVAKAFIWKDKNQVMELLKAGVSAEDIKISADATGTAETLKTDDKALEKNETIAVGRALAMLGYAASGEIASSEEMEEFEDYKAEKLLEEISEAMKTLETAENMPSLQKAWTGLPIKIRQEAVVFQKKEEMKVKLNKEIKDEKN